MGCIILFEVLFLPFSSSFFYLKKQSRLFLCPLFFKNTVRLVGKQAIWELIIPGLVIPGLLLFHPQCTERDKLILRLISELVYILSLVPNEPLGFLWYEEGET